MSSPTHELAAFAIELQLADIPERVRQRATEGIVDTIGVATFGAGLDSSRPLIDYAVRYGSGGASAIFGTAHRVHAPFAALANGGLAHAFEFDNLRQPSVGVHPGATLVPPAFAVAEEIDAHGSDVLVACIAGMEVMSRIGDAAHNSAEQVGFHSPGLTGTFGATVAAGRLIGLDAVQMASAFGIAGSLCSGLLAFTKAGRGGMVKRLHMGRAAEAGVLAARLALGGFAGPDTVLEGRFGFFDAYTRDPHLAKLVAGLGSEWETDKLCTKRYPAHVTAHTPLQALEELQHAHGFRGEDIAELRLATSAKVLSHHASTEPRDIATAQYSVPFCLAIGAYRDPNDPESFLDDPHDDPALCDLAQRVVLTLNERIAATKNDWETHLSVVLRDGRQFDIDRSDFRGAPSNPMARDEIERKFQTLCGDAGGSLSDLMRLEHLASVRGLFVGSGLAGTITR